MAVTRIVFVALLAATILGTAAAAQAAFIPWDPLTADSWIYVAAPQTRIKMHTVNAGDYEIGFDQAATGNRSRGMNALTFSYGGQSTGHLAAADLAGTFGVTNGGNTRTFKDLLVLVAIDAASLPAGFSMSLGVSGQAAYTFNTATDFGYYDQPAWDTGRPSGYYSITSPRREGIAYDFERGMVTVYAAQNVALGPGQSATLAYAFQHLPGRAVFSVYGYDADIGWVYHTNRAVIDARQPTAPFLSTFEVTPEPATLALLAAGAALIAGRRRRHP
jgi:hypothetical protein